MKNSNGHRPPVVFPSAAVPIVGLPFAIEGWLVQILITCKCERPAPVLIIGQPGQAAGQCRSCRRVYGLVSIGIDPRTHQPHFQLQVALPPAQDHAADEGVQP